MWKFLSYKILRNRFEFIIVRSIGFWRNSGFRCAYFNYTFGFYVYKPCFAPGILLSIDKRISKKELLEKPFIEIEEEEIIQ